MTRDRIAALLLATGGLGWLALLVTLRSSLEPSGATLLLGLAGLHGSLSFGVWRRRPWARWLSMGVAFFWVIGGLVLQSGVGSLGWAVVLLHAPLPLCLARPDGLHGRTSASLLLAGAASPIVLTLAVVFASLGYLFWPLAVCCAMALGGIVGVARGRTWGVLALILAGGALAGTAALLPWGDHGAAELLGLPGLLLLGAGLPFAGPMVRFMRR